MIKKNILIIGSGQRVQHTILPAVLCLHKHFHLVGVFSRKEKMLINSYKLGKIQTITDYRKIDFSSLDIIIVAITTANLPDVLKTMSYNKTHNVVLLLDTPVIPIRQFWAVKYFKLFKSVYVTEDYISMTLFDEVQKIIRKGLIGKLRHIYLLHNAYRHHAVAIMKKISSVDYVQYIYKRTISDRVSELRVRLPHGIGATILEPRDYSVGRLFIVGDKGFIADYPLAGENRVIVNYLYENGQYYGMTTKGLSNKRLSFMNGYSGEVCKMLSDTSLINYQKIEGVMNMLQGIIESPPRFRYAYESGIYDNLSMRMLLTLGFFWDIKLPFMQKSLINMCISYVVKFFHLFK